MYKKICLKEGEIWQNVFQTKLLSRLSRKVCRLLSSPILLRKLTNSNKKLRHNMRVNFLNDIRRLNNINKGEPKLHLVIKEQHILCLTLIIFNN